MAWIAVALLVVGLVLLVAGAQALVQGASRLAAAWGVPPLLVGLTVVAFGTSAPEFVVSVVAAAQGRAELAVANVVGSNLFNVLVVLGAGALVRPLLVEAAMVRREVPLMIAASGAAWLFAMGGGYARVEGVGLVLALLLYLVYSVRAARRESPGVVRLDRTGDEAAPRATVPRAWRSLVLSVVGVLVLALGGRLTIEGASRLAADLGASERLVGITVVAAGTSLPELATSLVAALRRQADIAVGNVVGSNLFNIFGVLGVAAIVAPLPVPAAMVHVDLPLMFLAALAALPVVWTGHRVSRGEGAVLVAAYAAFLLFLAGLW